MSKFSEENSVVTLKRALVSIFLEELGGVVVGVAVVVIVVVIVGGTHVVFIEGVCPFVRVDICDELGAVLFVLEFVEGSVCPFVIEIVVLLGVLEFVWVVFCVGVLVFVYFPTVVRLMSAIL